MNYKNTHALGVHDASALNERELCPELFNRNNNPVAYPNSCVHELFEKQVNRNPDAVAVVYKDEKISYGKLNGLSNQLAHFLRTRGVGPETLVGVCLPRSPEMLIALLGVWKAGGAYLPFDPSYPKERLSFMASDSGMEVLLTNENCRDLISLSRNITVCLDSDWRVIATESNRNPVAGTVPSNLAYVIYTSGSTGQPKGTMILHSGLVNYICWAIKTFGTDETSSIPVHSSIAYDSTVASLYPPLLAGGQIELLPEEKGVHSLLAALRHKKDRGKVVVTPAHLELLNRQLCADEMAGMTQTLVVAGEKLMAESLSKWRDDAQTTRFFNEYGPTEATVGCCAHEVTDVDPQSGPVPIGRPIDNTQIYVLDSNFCPVPSGVVGEMFISGAGVARGYLNRPELTNERFLVDPFSEKNGARMYRTGDLARHREDGALEYVGRLDYQVKLSGYRVELEEIEATLRGYFQVQSCVVVARGDSSEDKELVGYIVPNHGEVVDIGGLRTYLLRWLPAYMVPAQFMFLDSLPLTENGKIDRKGLPSPERTLDVGEAGREFDGIERKLTAIWMELLRVDNIGIHDDFFDLGGHSLLAIKAISRIREEFGVIVSVETFFPHVTISSLTKALIEENESSACTVHNSPSQPIEINPPFLWIGTGTIAKQLAVELGQSHPLVGVPIEPRIVEKLRSPYRLEELVKYLVSAVIEKQSHGPYYLGGFCRDGVVAYEVAQQLISLGLEVGLLALFESANPRPNRKAKIASGIKRFILRMAYQLKEIFQLTIDGIPHYIRARRQQVNRWIMRMAWRISSVLRALGVQSKPPDFMLILYGAVQSYKPKPLGCRTVLFRCSDWPTISGGDPYLGWRDLLSEYTETIEISGDHEGIFREPNVGAIAAQLKDHLENVRRID